MKASGSSADVTERLEGAVKELIDIRIEYEELQRKSSILELLKLVYFSLLNRHLLGIQLISIKFPSNFYNHEF